MDSEVQIIWSAKAKMTYFKVLDYLNSNWSQKELIQFNRRTEIVLQAIKKNPEIFPVAKKHRNIRKATIDKNNSCFYMVDRYKNKIFLLTFFVNRQNPERLVFEE